MTRLLRMLATAAIATTVLLVSSVPAATSAEPAARLSSQQLASMISAVRAETDASKQELAAWKIFQLAAGSELGSVGAKTLEELASLLDTPNDEVQRWVAATLGLFESRARFAAPKLMAILGKVDCPYVRENNSAGVVHTAILSITGVNPPPVVCLQKLQKPAGA